MVLTTKVGQAYVIIKLTLPVYHVSEKQSLFVLGHQLRIIHSELRRLIHSSQQPQKCVLKLIRHKRSYWCYTVIGERTICLFDCFYLRLSCRNLRSFTTQRVGLVVTRWSRSMKLLYAGPS